MDSQLAHDGLGDVPSNFARKPRPYSKRLPITGMEINERLGPAATSTPIADAGTTCRGCLRRFANNKRLALHLRRSFPCLVQNWAVGQAIPDEASHAQAPPQAWGHQLPKWSCQPLHLDFLLRLADGPGDAMPCDWLTGCVQEFLGPLPLLRATLDWWLSNQHPVWASGDNAAALRGALEDRACVSDHPRRSDHWTHVRGIYASIPVVSWTPGLEFVCVGNSAVFGRWGKLFGSLNLLWGDLEGDQIFHDLPEASYEVVCFIEVERLAAEPHTFRLALQVLLKCWAAGKPCTVISSCPESLAAVFLEPPLNWVRWHFVQAMNHTWRVASNRPFNDRGRLEGALLLSFFN